MANCFESWREITAPVIKTMVPAIASESAPMFAIWFIHSLNLKFFENINFRDSNRLIVHSPISLIINLIL